MPHHLHHFIVTLSCLLCMAVGAAELQLSGIPLDKRAKLVAQLSPRLDFIKAREPSSWRADDAAFFLKRLLVRAGHADADVQWELPGGNIILLKATPGPQYKYGSITATRPGILKQKKLRNYFLQPLVETELVDAKNAPYIASYNEAGSINVTNFLKSRGYWLSSVRIARKITAPTTRLIHLSLEIRPGALHTLAMPSFSGASAAEIGFFKTKIHPYVGKVADTATLSKVREVVENYYSGQGYEFAKIAVIPRHRNGRTHLSFRIDRGMLYQVDDVVITGNDKTRGKRIRRYFDDLKNKPYHRKNANDALSRLLATGAFKSAILTATPDGEADDGTDGEDKLDLHVDVQEAQARSLRSYVGIGSYEGFILGSSYTNLNFTGRLLRLNIRGEYSGRGFLGETSLTEPRFAGEDLQLNMRAFLLRRNYDGYNKIEGGIETAVRWSPEKEFSTRLYAGTSWVSSSSSSLTKMELGPSSYLHTKLGVQQTVDFRDSATLPSKGFYTSLLLETGTVTGDAYTGYVRGQLDTSYRQPINEDTHLVARFSTGAIRPENSAHLPIDLRQFSGGSDSVRSFDTRQLGPRSISDDPLGGQAYWNASLEYVQNISDPIKAVAFFDAGQVYRDFSDYGFSHPSYAAGIGIRIDLPIGPIRLEYGHNLNRKNGEPSGTFHFAIGTTF